MTVDPGGLIIGASKRHMHTQGIHSQTNKHAHNISKLFKKHFLKLPTFGGLY